MGSLRDVEVHIDVEVNDSELQHINSSINTIIDDFSELDASIRETANHLDSFNNQDLNDLFDEIAQMQREINELGNDITSSSDDVGDLNNQGLDDLLSEIERIHREINELGSDIINSEDGINDLNNQDLNNLLSEIERIQREINELDSDITGSVDEIDDLNNQDLTELESSFGGVQAAIVAVGAATAATFGIIGAELIEVEKVFARLEAQTGAHGAELEHLEGTAREVFNRGYTDSLGEVVEALALVKQNMHGVDASDFSNVTAKSILLADLFESEISEVTRGTQNMMEAFSITSEKAFDLFVKGGQNGINVSQDMFDQMSEFSAAAVQAGYSVEEWFGVMQRGAQNKVYDLDRINNSILEFGILTTEENTAVKESFDLLSDSTRDLWADMLVGEATSKDLSTTVINELKAMNDQTLANQIGATLWGGVWEENTKEVMYAMFETTAAMTGFEGAAQTAADAIENTFGNRMTSAWRTLGGEILKVVNNSTTEGFFNLIATKANESISYIVNVAQSIVDFADDIVASKDAAVEFVDTYTPLIAGLVGGVTAYYAITAGVGAYNAMLLLATGTGPIYTAATAGMTAVTSAFGAAVAFATSPIFLISAGIAAAIAVGIYLYRNWEELTVMAGDLWQKLNDNPFTAFLLKMNPVVTVARTLYNNFDSIKASFDRFKNAISNFEPPAWVTSIGGAIGDAASWVASKVPGLEVGLGRVPYDDMPALLHKDEAVLPADEANTLRQAGILQGNGTHPSVDLAASTQTYNQVSAVTSATSTTSQTVSNQNTFHIAVQGGSTNEETGQNLKTVLDEYFANMLLVMEG